MQVLTDLKKSSLSRTAAFSGAAVWRWKATVSSSAGSGSSATSPMPGAPDRSPRGERHARILRGALLDGFYTRSRVGSDTTRGLSSASLRCFYPRSRVGSDRPAAIACTNCGNRASSASKGLKLPCALQARNPMACFLHDFKELGRVRLSRPFRARMGFAQERRNPIALPQKIKGPSRSVAGFAPTCSIFPRQLAPR